MAKPKSRRRSKHELDLIKLFGNRKEAEVVIDLLGRGEPRSVVRNRHNLTPTQLSQIESRTLTYIRRDSSRVEDPEHQIRVMDGLRAIANSKEQAEERKPSMRGLLKRSPHLIRPKKLNKK